MNETKKKIIKAARELFEENGFAATTTKEISSRAGVSEVTLFRHFETKRNLFEQTVHAYMHPSKLEQYLDNEVKYDLEEDLITIANNMLTTYQKNLPLLRMVYKDRMKSTESKMKFKKHDRCAKVKLDEYFEQMQKLGRLKVDPRMARKFFMSNIIGFFMKNTFTMDVKKTDKEYFDWMIDRIIFAIKN